MLGMQTKEFGRLSHQQLFQLKTAIETFSALQKDFVAAIQENPEPLCDLFPAPAYWAHLYEGDFLELISLLVVSSGLQETVHEVAGSSDPQQSALNLLDVDIPDELPPMPGVDSEEVRRAIMMSSLMAVSKSVEAIHHYGVPLDVLVKEAGKGSDAALFNAVRIDPSVTACPTVAHRISRAVILQDAAFLRKLRNAYNGPSKKVKDAYGPLRYFLMLLDDEGVLDILTRDEQCTLLCEQLGLYPYDDNDAEKSLYQFIRRWKNQRVT